MCDMSEQWWDLVKEKLKIGIYKDFLTSNVQFIRGL